MYVKKRLRRVTPGSFVEIGVGQGVLSRLLLDLGWQGVGWDLNEAALVAAERLTQKAIGDGRYRLESGDWLAGTGDRADLVVSSMVLEHLDHEHERTYFERAEAVLQPGGLAVLLVPGSQRHWGIEDEIAGHHRRYSFDSLRKSAEGSGWRVAHMVGLTFPLSNILLRLSNRQVTRWETGQSELALEARTVQSGNRYVPWKTTFPRAARLVLNEAVLMPFHLLQQACSRSERSLVLYCECRPASP